MAIVSIGQWARKANLSLDEAARGITIKLFSSVIMDTRVDTGRMRGNWQTSVGSPIIQETNRKDKGGSIAESEVTRNVRSGKVNYLTNNVPYVEYWEQQDGMVAKNMARIQRIVKEEVRKAR
jgi:hypothetical protein|tara:strand:+ start:77 stop:442 length:366 start_codon:yes stop_codon:yes gene_type:complete